jgi:putative endonuclease
MAEHNILGKNGEEEAVKYLISHDYTVRHRNWRRGRKELDIVAEKEDELIIVEVKTRRNNLFAEPQDAVTPLKIRRLVLAADAYLRLFQIDLPVRFDIITIVGEAGSFTVEHIKEAFYPPVW